MAAVRIDAARPPEVGDPVTLDDIPDGAVRTVVIRRERDRLCLDRPRVGGQEIHVPEGITAKIGYSIAGVPCRVAVVTAASTDDGGEAGLWVTLDGPAERHQRRESFRVPAMRAIELR